jgi:hypothetical protein
MAECASALQTIGDAAKRAQIAQAVGAGVLASTIPADKTHVLSSVCTALIQSAAASAGGDARSREMGQFLVNLCESTNVPNKPSPVDRGRSLDAMLGISQRASKLLPGGEALPAAISAAIPTGRQMAAGLSMPTEEGLLETAKSFLAATARCIKDGTVSRHEASFIVADWKAAAQYVNMLCGNAAGQGKKTTQPAAPERKSEPSKNVASMIVNLFQE